MQLVKPLLKAVRSTKIFDNSPLTQPKTINQFVLWMTVCTMLFLIALVLAGSVEAQNIGINSSGNVPDASAMLDISSTNKGLLIPRVALTASNVAAPVTSPATALLVYNTATAGTAPNAVTPGFYYWNGSKWIPFGTGAATDGVRQIVKNTINTTASGDFLVVSLTATSGKALTDVSIYGDATNAISGNSKWKLQITDQNGTIYSTAAIGPGGLGPSSMTGNIGGLINCITDGLTCVSGYIDLSSADGLYFTKVEVIYTINSAAARTATAQIIATEVDVSTQTSSGSGKIKVGTYTGNGNATQAITGIGFQPDMVEVWKTPFGSGAYALRMQSQQEINQNFCCASAPYRNTNILQSLDADGFTVTNNLVVDGSGANTESMNENGQVFIYRAIKN